MTNKEKLEEMRSRKAEILELHTKLEIAKADFHKVMKEWLGISDGETMSVIDLAEAVLKLTEQE